MTWILFLIQHYVCIFSSVIHMGIKFNLLAFLKRVADGIILPNPLTKFQYRRLI